MGTMRTIKRTMLRNSGLPEVQVKKIANDTRIKVSKPKGKSVSWPKRKRGKVNNGS